MNLHVLTIMDINWHTHFGSERARCNNESLESVPENMITGDQLVMSPMLFSEWEQEIPYRFPARDMGVPRSARDDKKF